MRHSQDVNVLDSAASQKTGIGGLRYAVPVAALIVAADQGSKQWALSRLTQGPCSIDDACVDLFGSARFHLTFNTGAAFQSGQSLGPIIGLLAMVMSVVLLAMAWRRPDRLGALLLGGVAGGAIGNLVDRLFRADDGVLSGAVVDFIEVFDWYPIFNIADAAIVCSVMALIGYSLLRPELAIAGTPNDVAVIDDDVDGTGGSVDDEQSGAHEEVEQDDRPSDEMSRGLSD